MRACIIAVGSELLTPFRVDTNSLFITERLNTVGFDVRLKTVVGDNVDAVLVNGQAGRIVSTAASQINFVLPASVSPGPAAISVRAKGAAAPGADMGGPGRADRGSGTHGR